MSKYGRHLHDGRDTDGLEEVGHILWVGAESGHGAEDDGYAPEWLAEKMGCARIRHLGRIGAHR